MIWCGSWTTLPAPTGDRRQAVTLDGTIVGSSVAQSTGARRPDRLANLDPNLAAALGGRDWLEPSALVRSISTDRP
jgi:hypothetical protein